MNQNDNIDSKSLASWFSLYDLLCSAIAVILGLVIGWIDIHTTEVTVTIVSLLLSGYILGLLQPKAAWRWSVLIVLGLPAMVIYAHLIVLQTPESSRIDIRIIFVSLLFALFGFYIGVLIRRILRGLTSGSS